jgi:hypothetical protein
MYSTESSLHNRLSQVNTEMGEVAKLPLLFADYHYIVNNPDTTIPYFTQNSFQQLFDNPSRIANPYGQALMVCAASTLAESRTGSVLFMVPSNLYLSNKTSLSNLNISADFEGTNTFVSLSADAPYLHKYSSIGLKTITIKIVHGNNIWLAKTTIDVKDINIATSNLGATLCPTPCYHALWRDRVSQNNGIDLSKSLGYIVFGNTNTTTESGPLKLRNPVIFIEGQDILNEFQFIRLYQLINRGNDNPTGLINKLHNDGRDLIILDFGDMRNRNLRDLSETVRRLINYVNQHLDPAVSGNKLTVAGHSMGGVLARYTLAKMEQTYCENHNVGLYVSYDAPHKGANVALGFQELTYQSWAAGGFFVEQDLLGAYLQLISISTKEMANAYFNVSNYGPTPEHISFYNELDQMGMPQKCRTVGVALGNTANNALDPIEDFGYSYNPGDALLNFSQTGNQTVNITVRSVNNTSTQSILDYYLNVKIFSEKSWWLVIFTGSTNNETNLELVNSTRPFLSPKAFDNAPGGYLTIPRQIANGLGGNATTYFRPHVNIIPTTSALNLRGTDLFQINKTLTQMRDEKSHSFDEIYLMTNNYNYPHVGIYPNLSDNIFSEIIHTISATPSNLPQNPLTILGNKTYNFGDKSFFQVLDNAEIGNGGRLLINANAGVNYNGTGVVPSSNSTYQVSTSTCSPIININNGGKMIIGESSPNNIGSVILKMSASIKVRNLGELIVNNNSALIIESGAKLIFEKGASIKLNGSNAIIIVKHGGKIQIGQDAVFNYTGDGFIRFETAYPYSASIEAIGSNAQFKLVGGAFGSASKKLMEVVGTEGLTDATTYHTPAASHNLSLFSLQNGHVILSPNARIIVSGSNTKADLRSLDIRAAIPNLPLMRHRGIVLNGQLGNVIYKVTVTDAKTGIQSNNVYGGADIDILQFTASSCGTALSIWGAGARIQDAEINNCTTAIRLEGMSRSTRLYRTKLYYNTNGVYAINCANNVVELYQPNIYNNYYGVYGFNSQFAALCGIIRNNASSIQTGSSFLGANVYLVQNANFIADPIMRVGAGKIDMSNVKSVAVRQSNAAYGPFIDQSGSTLLTDIDYSITGTLVDRSRILPPYNTLIAKNNLWGITNGVSRSPIQASDYNTNYRHTLPFFSSFRNLIISDIAPIAAYNPCGAGSTGGSGGDDRMRGWVGGEVTPIRDLPNKSLSDGRFLKETVQEGYSHFFDLVPNYPLAVRNLTDALNVNFTPQELEEWSVALVQVNAQLIEALGEGVAEGYITKFNADNVTYSELVSGVLNLQDQLLLTFTNDSQSQFIVSIAKASLLRMLDNREASIDVLNSISNGLYPELNTVKESYLCMTTKEKLLLEGSISPYAYDSVYNCSNFEDFTLLPPPFMEEGEGGELSRNNNTQSIFASNPINIYPNPTNGLFTLKFKGEEGATYQIEVIDLMSKKIGSFEGIFYRDNTLNFNLASEPSGVYFIRMTAGNEVHLKKIVLTK